MGRKKPVVPKIKTNPKRTATKLKRGFGRGMIEKLGISEVEWCQRHDPLFKVRGKERK